ncbi:hypothetical protein AcV5_008344 [Taiwanofungus camphoratus]|nr:hypothetical protein AcV5_008344 [Antrodia cinnamomea]KAI0955761.1 hypothetical protein AcV7_006340 [Antrodia cinnamomea]
MKPPRPRRHSPKLKPVNIAVMGPTGSGKTSFINLASSSHLRVGCGLESATDRIQSSQPFVLDDYYSITLVDTPGFDDTTKSDAETLTIIANFLSDAYRKKVQLNGIIYLHRISDNRMGGSAMRNFNLFRDICGEAALSNSAIVLNMWDEVSRDVREARERELFEKDIFFKPAITAGASKFYHENSVPSAHTIIRYLAAKHPKPLQIQKELVDKKLPVYGTIAGTRLLGELAEKELKHQKQLQEMEREIQEAIRLKDEDDRRELEEARRRLEEAGRKLMEEQARLRADRGKPIARSPLLQRFIFCFGPAMDA